MWIWIIIGACAIGAIIGFLNSDGDSSDAAGGALAGGCIAIGCLGRLAFAGIIIIGILWLCQVIFG